ncbi:MAG: DUF1552 domain-containing protein [Acidobacteriota bacterium]|nr:DUF1552 domain-containing protein [Acidobacteriota bacterium]
MMITKMSLPRRTFLRGMGATVALPLLDAMVPAFTALANTPAAPVRRFGVVYVPNGMIMESWTPRGEGTLELSPILQPLAPFHDRMLVLSGLDGLQSRGGTHTTAATRFLTGAIGRVTGDGIEAGTSIDQIAAQQFGQYTQLASLELSLDRLDLVGTCDNTTCAFINTLSWASPTTQAPGEDNPRVVFERLFGDNGTTDPVERLARLRRNRSILDSLTEALADLEQELGAGDRSRLDEYLTAVRDVERRIQKAEEQSAMELPSLTRPGGVPASYDEHCALMVDLQVLAFQLDLTRVSTFMMGREYSGRTYPQIGITEAHHPLSHHQDDPAKIALVAKLNTYHVSLFASYLEKLRTTADGEGSLLDHTLMLYGAGMADSNSHDSNNLPLMLIGSQDQFNVKGGRHLRYDHEPAATLLATVLDKLGVPVDRIANSRGKLNLNAPVDTLVGV